MSNGESFASRLERVREQISAAAERAGRTADGITLVAVSKHQPLEAIREAQTARLLDFGENYVQEAQEKSGAESILPCRWHMLGHLQSNKAKTAIQIFDLIQSVDSVRLATAIGNAAQKQDKVQKVLLQVHLGDEATKFGLAPASVIDAVDEVLNTPGVSLLGLMGIASQSEQARPQFQALRRLFDTMPAAARTILSMGMTSDFEAGIEEGATMVRIGTALFGARS